MTFDFPTLIAHAAKTRSLGAGTIIGSGTVSNADQEHGYSCIAEIRMIETIAHGKPSTPFMRFGDRIRIEVLDRGGASVFGAIEQVVEQVTDPATTARVRPGIASGDSRSEERRVGKEGVRKCRSGGAAYH